MILWGIVIGVLIGWSLPGWEGFGALPGGLAGWIAGWTLRSTIRKEMGAAEARTIERVRALIESGTRPDVRPDRPSVPYDVPDPRPAAIVPQTDALPTEPEAGPWTPPMDTPPLDAPPLDAPLVGEPASAPDPTPAEPTIADRLVAAARAWLLGGNTIVRAGLVILFVGLSFLARYAASAGLFPIEARLALVVVVGVALLVVGFRTRLARPGFALALQGAGVATIYLTIFAGARLFPIIPATPAIVLMVLVCALGCALALLQNAQSLAVAAFLGGFAVPVLVGGPDGSALVLFGYYVVLNLGVLFFAAARRWRAVSLIGFVATFGMAGLLALPYTPANYPIAQSFLLISVLIYLAAAVFAARPMPDGGSGAVDTTLLLGPAIAGFGLQVALVRHNAFGSAFSALGFAALYLLVAAVMMRRGRRDYRVMNEAMLAIGIGFVTLAVPLALGARWTTSAWAVEGAGAFWIGMRQARWMPRLFGMLLQLVAALLFLANLAGNVSVLPFVDPGFVGATLVAIAALATAWWLRTPLGHSGSRWAASYARAEPAVAKPAFLFGFAFWVLALTLEIARTMPSGIAGVPPQPAIAPNLQSLLIMLAYIASAAVSRSASRRYDWPVAAWPGRATLIVLAIAFAARIGQGAHILQTPDWAIWLIAVGLHYRLLHQDETTADGDDLTFLHRAVHIGGAWLVAAIACDCLWLGVDRGRLWNTSWAGVASLVAAIATLLLLTLWAGAARPGDTRAHRWPLRGHTIDYGWYAALPIAGLTLVATPLIAMIAAGYTAPLPYLPLLNPIDLALLLAIGALLLWRRTMLGADPAPPHMGWLRERAALAPLAGLAFIVVNTIWLRFAHHALGVPWSATALLDSFVVQMGLAILWTLLALAMMLFAHRRPNRVIWIVGAGLLALTVAKLLLVDLNNEGGAVRIVTFMAVGVLMLVVGYFAPLPPKAEVGDAARATRR